MTAKPAVYIDEWEGFSDAMRDEVLARLSVLSAKMEKRVDFHQWAGRLKYSEDVIHVYVCCQDIPGVENLRAFHNWEMKLGEEVYKLPDEVPSFSSLQFDGLSIIDDGNPSVCLARVYYNTIVIPHTITATNSKETRAILSRCIEKAGELFNFNVKDILQKREDLTVANYKAYYASASRGRLLKLTEKVMAKKTLLDKSYKDVVQISRELPVLEVELTALENFVNNIPKEQVEKQVKIMHRLLDDGLYKSITPSPDGTVNAVTGPILISGISGDGNEYKNVPLGSYEIVINPNGSIKIYSVEKLQVLDKQKLNKVPHPHVDQANIPCLGNILTGIAKSVGNMRVAEALMILHGFLQAYNEDGAYGQLHMFAARVRKNACKQRDCFNFCSPFCIVACDHRDALKYGCDYCRERHTEWCFTLCPYNAKYYLMSPCHNCVHAREVKDRAEMCIIKCKYNKDFKLATPCMFCKVEEGKRGEACKYYLKVKAAGGGVTRGCERELIEQGREKERRAAEILVKAMTAPLPEVVFTDNVNPVEGNNNG